MYAKITGYKPLNFVSQDGTPVVGNRIYITYSDPKVKGFATDSFYVSAEKVATKDIVVDAEIEVVYNRYGKVENLIFA